MHSYMFYFIQNLLAHTQHFDTEARRSAMPHLLLVCFSHAPTADDLALSWMSTQRCHSASEMQNTCEGTDLQKPFPLRSSQLETVHTLGLHWMPSRPGGATCCKQSLNESGWFSPAQKHGWVQSLSTKMERIAQVAKMSMNDYARMEASHGR